MSADDDRAAKLVINLGALSNVSLAAFKGAAGAMTGSSALIADAVHSLADLASDAVTYASHTFARAPADPTYPYGRGRAEAFGSFLVSTTLVVAGASLGWESIQHLLHIAQAAHAGAGAGAAGAHSLGTALSGGLSGTGASAATAGSSPSVSALLGRPGVSFINDSALAVIAVVGTVGSIAVKEALYRWTMKIATKLRSSVLAANAWHHRVDAATSVVAAVGVGGALAGVPVLDPLCALLVAGSIVQQGGAMCWESINELLDRNMDNETLGAIAALLRESPDVTRHHRLRGRRVGPVLHIDVEIGLRPHLTISAAHHVADDLRRRILQGMPQVGDVLVHTFPDNEGVQAVYCADEHCSGKGGRGAQQHEAEDGTGDSGSRSSSGSDEHRRRVAEAASQASILSHHDLMPHQASHSGDSHGGHTGAAVGAVLKAGSPLHVEHEHGHGHGEGAQAAQAPALKGPAQGTPNMTASQGPAQMEAQIRRAALRVSPNVRAVTHLRLYYGPPEAHRPSSSTSSVGRGSSGLGSGSGSDGGSSEAAALSVRVEMEVLLPLDFRIRDAVHTVRAVRSAVEALPFVSVADVHLEVEPA